MADEGNQSSRGPDASAALPEPGPLTDDERSRIAEAIKDFYGAAGAPCEPTVVFVASPSALDPYLRRRRRLRRVTNAAYRDWARRRRPLRAMLTLAIPLLAAACLWSTVTLIEESRAALDDVQAAQPAALPHLWPVVGACLVLWLGWLIFAPRIERRWGDGAVSPAWRSPADLTGVEPSHFCSTGTGAEGDGELRQGRVWDLVGVAERDQTGVDAEAALDARWTGGEDPRLSRWPDVLRVSSRYRRRQRLLVTVAHDGGRGCELPIWTSVDFLEQAVDAGALRPSDRLRHELAVRSATRRAFAWVGFRYLAVVVEPPVIARTESLPDGTRQLHCDGEPALVWADGSAHYFVHGVCVPKTLMAGQWSVPRIHAERNGDVRRLAIEKLGWLRYVEQARLLPVAREPDPGNGNAELLLYDIPDATARLLVMRNGSPDRASGAVKDYAEFVPRWIDDPVEAAAWQYGCTRAEYVRLQRRT